jgi:hypothetical protein
MAAKKRPRSKRLKIKSAIEITVRKRGAKGRALLAKIKAAFDDIPTDVLEHNETIVVRADTEGNNAPYPK